MIDWYKYRQYCYGNIIEYEAGADTGKTLAMVTQTLYLLCECGYEPEEVLTNIPIFIDGIKNVDNEQWKYEFARIVNERRRHLIILGDELDQIYLSRDFKDPIQTRALASINQFTKGGINFLFNRHWGSGVDKLIRDCTQISIRPEFHQEEDSLYLEVLNGINLQLPCPFLLRLYPISPIMKLYDRFRFTT